MKNIPHSQFSLESHLEPFSRQMRVISSLDVWQSCQFKLHVYIYNCFRSYANSIAFKTSYPLHILAPQSLSLLGTTYMTSGDGLDKEIYSGKEIAPVVRSLSVSKWKIYNFYTCRVHLWFLRTSQLIALRIHHSHCMWFASRRFHGNRSLVYSCSPAQAVSF